MKSVMITGAYPPDVCGVGDYTSRLIETEAARSGGCLLYLDRNWNVRTFFRKIREINNFKADTIFMQSPTKGYGWSLLPHMIAVWFSCFSDKKFVVMLHEYIQLSFKARLATKIMLAAVDHAIFSNDTDRTAAVRDFTRLRQRSSVIKIFSNIPCADCLKPVSEREIDLVNFGQIRPVRGIEQFIEAAKRIRNNNPELRIALAGQIRPEYADYYEEIKLQCEANHIEMHVGYDDKTTAEFLNNCKIAYLPFPDGISERRGSFLASAYNGAVVVSNSGRFTTAELRNSVIIAEDETAFEKIIDTLSLNEKELMEHQRKCRNFIFQNVHGSWEEVMEEYLTIARKINKDRK
ncbi:MAG: glycosyltransferase [Rikenellaceae bacterium]|nr:glycosyltransferase [Rikenellaceae bacterium]